MHHFIYPKWTIGKKSLERKRKEKKENVSVNRRSMIILEFNYSLKSGLNGHERLVPIFRI